MDIELVTIGTELLLGFTVDTNGAEIARVLSRYGVRVVRRTAVGDVEASIRDAVAAALRRTGAVLTTGGLGPTRDDITKKAVADLLGSPLEFHQGLWEALLQRYQRLGRVPAASNRTQAEIPRGAVILPNHWGTAPGLWLDSERGLVIMLPGVPIEMRHLLTREVVPRLAERAGSEVIRSTVLRTSGIPESSLAERIGPIEGEIAPLSLAYLPGLEGVDLRLTAWNLPAAEADARLTDAAKLLRSRVGDHLYGEGDADLAAVVLDLARSNKLLLAIGESCTGGLLGARLTAVPDSSDVFLGGAVCYANELKVQLLGVPEALLAEHGAVSEPVVRAMAEGAVRRLGANIGLAVTGIAGPGGGNEEKPVGTVWFGLAFGEAVHARKTVLPGTREEIRARAAQAALFLLYRRLSQ